MPVSPPVVKVTRVPDIPLKNKPDPKYMVGKRYVKIYNLHHEQVSVIDLKDDSNKYSENDLKFVEGKINQIQMHTKNLWFCETRTTS